MARRNQRTFFTGNSAWQSSASAVQMHGKPLLMSVVDAITQGWLRPYLQKQRGLPKYVQDDIPETLVWFSLDNLRIRPNEAEEIQAAYDRFEVDADALRQVSNITQESKPTNRELARQVLLHLVRTNPGMAGYAVNALRESFGVNALPEFEGPAEPAAMVEAPPSAMPDGGPGNLPGQRSVDKQTDPPPTPPATSDPNDNERGRGPGLKT